MGVQERRERERAARRKAVLDAARELVLEHGFGATTRQIASRCELSEATLFFYFQSKDEILSSLLFEGIEFMGRGLDEIAAASLPPRKRIARIWGFFHEVLQTHPEFYHLFAYLAHPQATQAVSSDVRADLLDSSRTDLRKFGALLADVVGPDRAGLAAELVWSAFMGMFILRESRRNLGGPPRAIAQDLDGLFDLMWTGIAPPAANDRKPKGSQSRKKAR